MLRTVETPSPGDSTTKAASTAFVATSFAPLASPTFTGTPTMPTGTTATTQTANDNSTKLATTAYVDRTPGGATATAAAPTGTTSATSVMMAIGGTFTPACTTRGYFIVSGQMANDTINDGVTVDLRFGTGTAPVNGAAVTGTLVGIEQTRTSLVAGSRGGFTVQGRVTGLSIATAYWVDISLKRVTGGTATVTGVTCTTFEV